MSVTPTSPQPPVVNGSMPANAQNAEQPNEDRPAILVSLDGSNGITTAPNTAGLTPITPQSPLETLNTGTRPLNVRKESSIAFSNVGSSNDRDSRPIPEPVVESAQASEGNPADRDYGVTAAANYEERTSRRMLGRRGTSENRSVYSTLSAMTVAEAQTPYVNMLLALDHIHTINDMLAFSFCWLLLAGFVVLPGTIKKTIPDLVEGNVQNENLKNALNLVIEHVPLVAVAGAVSAIGLVGMVVMWVRWRGNYIWLVRNIFLPGCTNALAGLVSTLVSIFVINKGDLDTLSIVILSVVGGVTLFNFLMIVLYQWIWLSRLQKEHKRLVGKHSAGKTGSGKYKGHDDEYDAGRN